MTELTPEAQAVLEAADALKDKCLNLAQLGNSNVRVEATWGPGTMDAWDAFRRAVDAYRASRVRWRVGPDKWHVERRDEKGERWAVHMSFGHDYNRKGEAYELAQRVCDLLNAADAAEAGRSGT